MAKLQRFGLVAATCVTGLAMLSVFSTAQTNSSQKNPQTSSQTRTPVLVELFTSEGCSSCPPADALLGRLQREQPVPSADIIVLEEHVDYWDEGGWHDRFSSSQYTERQRDYAPRLRVGDIYTPQMVVDGSAQLVGNDGAGALHSIAQAAQTPKITLTLSTPVVSGRQIGSSVSAASTTPLPKADLYAALVDASALTLVRGGENSGRHLDHVSVVRSLQHIGKLQDLGSGPLTFQLSAPSDDNAANMRLIVFAQNPNLGAIRAATSIPTKQ